MYLLDLIEIVNCVYTLKVTGYQFSNLKATAYFTVRYYQSNKIH